LFFFFLYSLLLLSPYELFFILWSFQINSHFLFFIFDHQVLPQTHHYLMIIIFHLHRFHFIHLHYFQNYLRRFLYFLVLICLLFLQIFACFRHYFIHCYLASQHQLNFHKMFIYRFVAPLKYLQLKVLAMFLVCKLAQILCHLAICFRYILPLLLTKDE